MTGFFDGCEFHHVPRANNEAADALARGGSTRADIPPGVSLEHLRKPSIRPSPDTESICVEADPGAAAKNPGAAAKSPGAAAGIPGATPSGGPADTAMAEADPDNSSSSADNSPASTSLAVFTVGTVPEWAQLLYDYFTSGIMPQDRTLATRILRRAKAYTIINQELYKRSMAGVYQRCVSREQGQDLLREIHQGECGHHATSRAIAAKALRHGLYWPTALQDTDELVKRCNGCQRFSAVKHTPGLALKTISLAWPFAVWGLDMVGPFKRARGGMTHLLVAVDKFTKWIEAKPIKKLDGKSTVIFFTDIINRYGYPHSIITDNGTNFAKGAFARFCGKKGIRLDLASVATQNPTGRSSDPTASSWPASSPGLH